LVLSAEVNAKEHAFVEDIERSSRWHGDRSKNRAPTAMIVMAQSRLDRARQALHARPFRKRRSSPSNQALLQCRQLPSRCSILQIGV
jgi:hypothetical protein